MGNFSRAKQVLEDLLQEFETLEDAYVKASTLTYLGLELEASGDFVGAAKAFGDAEEILLPMGAQGYTLDVLAGRARCAVADGNFIKARQLITPLWEALQGHGSMGMEFPIWAYLTCAQVFEAAGDEPKRRQALELGYREIITMAERIREPVWRQTFLEKIPEHRAISEEKRRIDEAASRFESDQ